MKWKNRQAVIDRITRVMQIPHHPVLNHVYVFDDLYLDGALYQRAYVQIDVAYPPDAKWHFHKKIDDESDLLSLLNEIMAARDSCLKRDVQLQDDSDIAIF